MKKLLTVTLVCILLLTLCLPVFADDYEFFLDMKYEEPITFSILTRDGKVATIPYDSSDPTRRSASENAWITAYEDYLNIKVDRIIAEDDTALNAQISTRLASGDLPDAILCNKEMAAVLIENEVVQDLSPALESFLPGSTYVKDALDEAIFTFGTENGKIYAFPITNNWYNATQLLWIRQDWLNKVNKTAPTTIDELVDVARAFKEAKLGGKDTVPLGMDNDNQYYDYRGVLAAYGAVYDTWQQQEDGTYVYGCVMDGMKQGLLKLQEMYKEGLLTPDFATGGHLAQDVANSVCGMYYASGWHSVTDIKTNMVNDPDAEWICVSIPTLDGQHVKQWTNGASAWFVLVNAEYEYPEAIFKMMELEQQVYTNPSPTQLPKLYTAEDGYLMWDMRVFRNFGATDFDFVRSRLICEHLEKGSTSADVEPLIYDFYTQIEAALAGDRSLIGRYLCQTMAYPIQDDLRAKGLLCPSYGGPLTENMQLYQETLYADLNSTMVKVIMGEDISVFEEAVRVWYDNGGQTITDDVNAYYQSR